MKTMLFSDVHGVATALRTFLREVDLEAPDQVVFLGDLLTLGPSPEEVADLFLDRNFLSIQGNHDEFLGNQTRAEAYTKEPLVLESIGWTRSVLAPTVLKRVAEFHGSRLVSLGEERAALCYHGTPESNTEVMNEGQVAARLGSSVATEVSACFGGHTHVPFVVRCRGVWYANTGSCGMPFFDPAIPGLPRLLPQIDFAVVLTRPEGVSVELRSVEVDRDLLRRENQASKNPLARFAAQQYGYLPSRSPSPKKRTRL